MIKFKIKLIFVIIAVTFLFSCSTVVNVNKELAKKNLSIIKNTRYAPSLGPYPSYMHNIIATNKYSYYFIASLNKVNNKEVRFTYRPHYIKSGNKNLLLECRIGSGTSSDPKVIKNNVLVNINLEKGHTYELKPIKVKRNMNSVDSCTVEIIDLTINENLL